MQIEDVFSVSSEESIPVRKFPLAIESDSYVVLKLLPHGKKKVHPVYYIGSVICADGVGWKIQCMRRKQGASNAFLYPPQEDIDTYNKDTIVKVLKAPKVARNVYYFHSDDICAFEGALR
jgi:hypothetical protein